MDDSDPNEKRCDGCFNSGDGYDVGYKKPPKATRFRRGQSGNPRGRPRGSKSFRTLIEAHYERKVTFLEDGKQKRITMKEAVVRRAFRAAIVDGDVRMLKELGGLREPPMPEPVEELSFTLVFDNEKQQTYQNGELIRDHAAERAARRSQADKRPEPE